VASNADCDVGRGGGEALWLLQPGGQALVLRLLGLWFGEGVQQPEAQKPAYSAGNTGTYSDSREGVRVKWSLERLEKACRKVLKSRTKLSLAKLPDPTMATATWESDRPVIIKVDNQSVALLNGVIHELLHVVLDDDLTLYDQPLEEAIIEAFEEAVCDYVKRSRSRLSWWRKEIKTRIGRK
jgi:hypothetical protein